MDFGRTAAIYERDRKPYPARLYAELAERRVGVESQRVLDLGSGTGRFARGLTDADVVALDRSHALLLESSTSLSQVCGNAASLPFRDDSFDVVTAAQCWTWFERASAAFEAARVLRDGGRLCVLHYDWIPRRGSVVEATENLIVEHNPAWARNDIKRFSGGTGIYGAWTIAIETAGFGELETFSFDVEHEFSHESWRGRIRACGGVGGSLDAAAVDRFDEALAELLHANFGVEPLIVPYRIWVLTADGK